jgi:histone H3/H4
LESGRASLPQDASLGIDDAENSFAFRLPDELRDDEVEGQGPSDDSEPEPLPQDLETANVSLHMGKPSKQKARLKESRYGIPYPSLPSGVVKKLTTAALKSSGKSKTRVNAPILAAVMQASDWFFEQLGEDLEAYSNHAKRKTIDESDVVTLMKRWVVDARMPPY